MQKYFNAAYFIRFMGLVEVKYIKREIGETLPGLTDFFTLTFVKLF